MNRGIPGDYSPWSLQEWFLEQLLQSRVSKVAGFPFQDFEYIHATPSGMQSSQRNQLKKENILMVVPYNYARFSGCL